MSPARALFDRMGAWVHRAQPPTLVLREIVDPVVCDDCLAEFATLVAYHFHHCPADE